MKIYTRLGDSGDTDLYGGKRVSKNDLRIECIGTVDELNASIGEILSIGVASEIVQMLNEIQADLFVFGADLASIGAQKYRGKDDVPRVSEARVIEFENWIDFLDSHLKPMNAFILPGGCMGAAKLHVARTICRKAERFCSGLFRKVHKGENQSFSPVILKYMNRLSDLLFTMARFENAKNGVAEKKWIASD